jgi:hypothetical protein
MNSRKILDAFSRPSTEEFLKEEYWAINEAAYELTTWPQKLCLSLPMQTVDISKKTSLQTVSENLKLERSLFYFSEDDLSHEKMETPFQIVFEKIKKAIENQKLPAEYVPLNEGTQFLVKPTHVVLWALLEGLILPDNLQIALGIGQLGTSDLNNTLIRRVKIKVFGQILLQEKPELKSNVTELCKETLKRMGELPNRDLTAIRGVLNELFDSKGEKGRRSILNEKKNSRKYFPEAIPEVLQRDVTGRMYYNLPLLKLVLAILLDERKASVEPKISFEQILEQFMKDDIVSLYIDQTSEIILKLISINIDELLYLGPYRWKYVELALNNS